MNKPRRLTAVAAMHLTRRSEPGLAALALKYLPIGLNPDARPLAVAMYRRRTRRWLRSP